MGKRRKRTATETRAVSPRGAIGVDAMRLRVGSRRSSGPTIPIASRIFGARGRFLEKSRGTVKMCESVPRRDVATIRRVPQASYERARTSAPAGFKRSPTPRGAVVAVAAGVQVAAQHRLAE
jgi:hypothetical protein